MYKATLKDLEAILSFCLELKDQNARMSFTDLDTKEKLIDTLEDPNISLYITCDGPLVTAMFRALRGQGNKRHSVYVACAVKKEYRQKNLATQVVAYGLKDLKAQGVLIARTKIYSWNKPSIATIKKCGFQQAGMTYMHEYDEERQMYIDDLIFHKVL